MRFCRYKIILQLLFSSCATDRIYREVSTSELITPGSGMTYRSLPSLSYEEGGATYYEMDLSVNMEEVKEVFDFALVIRVKLSCFLFSAAS